MNVVLTLLEILFQLSFVVLPIYLFIKQRSWTRSISKANARPPVLRARLN